MAMMAGDISLKIYIVNKMGILHRECCLIFHHTENLQNIPKYVYIDISLHRCKSLIYRTKESLTALG